MLLYSKKLELVALYTITANNTDSSKLLAKLDSSHFHFPATKTAFNRFIHILRTKSEHMDWVSLTEDPALRDSDRELLNSFDPHSYKTKSVENIANTLEQFRVGRAVYAMAQSAIEQLKDSFDGDSLIDSLADKLANARSASEDQTLYHIGIGNNTTDKVLEILDQNNKPPVIPTGFATFDSIMGGFPDNGLVILAATTSSGKSTMANQLAININRIGWDVCKVSLEMPYEQELQRFLSNLTGIEHSKIHNKKLSPKEIKIVKKAYKEFVLRSKQEGRRLTIISPTEDMSLTQILMLVKPFNFKVIIIDYISLLKENGNVEQWKHLSDVAREAKRYTLKTGTLIIMLAQLDDDNKIRYSRAVKEHADVVWSWSVTDADRENEKFTVNQTKGRNQGLISFEVSGKFACMQITDAGNMSMGDGEEDDDSDGASDISDLMG